VPNLQCLIDCTGYSQTERQKDSIAISVSSSVQQCNIDVIKQVLDGPKNKLFWELITLQQLIGERHVTCEKFPNFVKKKYKSSMSVHLNILCQICINLHWTWIMLNLPKSHEFYPIFNSCLCSQELKWTVLITVITYAAGIRITVNTFAICRKMTSCFSRTEQSHTVHATLLVKLHSHVPEFTEPEKWPPIVWI